MSVSQVASLLNSGWFWIWGRALLNFVSVQCNSHGYAGLHFPQTPNIVSIASVQASKQTRDEALIFALSHVSAVNTLIVVNFKLLVSLHWMYNWEEIRGGEPIHRYTDGDTAHVKNSRKTNATRCNKLISGEHLLLLFWKCIISLGFIWFMVLVCTPSCVNWSIMFFPLRIEPSSLCLLSMNPALNSTQHYHLDLSFLTWFILPSFNSSILPPPLHWFST